MAKYEAVVRATFVFQFEDDGDLAIIDQAHELATHSIIENYAPDDVEVISIARLRDAETVGAA